jgi:cysteine desulfurase
MKSGLRYRLACGVSVLMLGLTAAQAEEARIRLQAQPLALALKEIGRQSGVNVLYTPDAVDGVQALGKLPIDISHIDLLSLSAHKIGGPQGVGALVLRDADLDLRCVGFGGGQERRHRPGTENIAGIAGFAAALTDIGDLPAEAERQSQMRDRLESGSRHLAKEIRFFGDQAPRLANTSCFALPNVSAQTLLMALDLQAVAVSAGSACSSGKLAASPVLTAMGAGAWAAGAIRVSLGWATDADQIEQFLERFAVVLDRVTRQGAA